MASSAQRASPRPIGAGAIRRILWKSTEYSSDGVCPVSGSRCSANARSTSCQSSSVSADAASGSSCSTFPACITALDAGRNTNYDGPSGYLSVNATGEAVGAVFERFTFDENGNVVGDGLLRIGDA